MKSAKEGIVDPVVTSFKAPSTSLLTTTKEENYNMGYATGQTDVLVVDAALTVMTDGAALASKARNLGTGFKNFIKDPKKSVMGFLKPGGKKGILGKSGAVGDGRFKTRGSLLEKTIDSLDTAAKKMNRSVMEKAPFHILIKQTTNGINSLEIVKNEKSRFFSKGGEGSSGKKGKSEGTGKDVTASIAQRQKEIIKSFDHLSEFEKNTLMQRAREGVISPEKWTGNISGVKEFKNADEFAIADKWLQEGKNVEKLADVKGSDGNLIPGADFNVDGMIIEAKTANSKNMNTTFKKAIEAINRQGENVVIDGRKIGYTVEDAKQIIEIINRKTGGKGNVEIWINDGSVIKNK
ncbi:CdiA C-terminal domain-containing protein [Paenibacillus azoreducens]|uniref:CdiA C-terminal domain-containing protein n=1 Tax=Paenibacillus azoreducens TaxID=116718 RepID=UPI001BB434D0|nr:hypothetical protein [Paenibacillus azoreducens]